MTDYPEEISIRLLNNIVGQLATMFTYLNTLTERLERLKEDVSILKENIESTVEGENKNIGQRLQDIESKITIITTNAQLIRERIIKWEAQLAVIAVILGIVTSILFSWIGSRIVLGK